MNLDLIINFFLNETEASERLISNNLHKLDNKLVSAIKNGLYNELDMKRTLLELEEETLEFLASAQGQNSILDDEKLKLLLLRMQKLRDDIGDQNDALELLFEKSRNLKVQYMNLSKIIARFYLHGSKSLFLENHLYSRKFDFAYFSKVFGQFIVTKELPLDSADMLNEILRRTEIYLFEDDIKIAKFMMIKSSTEDALTIEELDKLSDETFEKSPKLRQKSSLGVEIVIKNEESDTIQIPTNAKSISAVPFIRFSTIFEAVLSEHIHLFVTSCNLQLSFFHEVAAIVKQNEQQISKAFRVTFVTDRSQIDIPNWLLERSVITIKSKNARNLDGLLATGYEKSLAVFHKNLEQAYPGKFSVAELDFLSRSYRPNYSLNCYAKNCVYLNALEKVHEQTHLGWILENELKPIKGMKKVLESKYSQKVKERQMRLIFDEQVNKIRKSESMKTFDIGNVYKITPKCLLNNQPVFKLIKMLKPNSLKLWIENMKIDGDGVTSTVAHVSEYRLDARWSLFPIIEESGVDKRKLVRLVVRGKNYGFVELPVDFEIFTELDLVLVRVIFE